MEPYAKRPNPQGKGLTPALDYMLATTSAIELPSVTEDSSERIARDYLASLLVLSCTFKFRPAIGGTYHIYLHLGCLLLSLVAPNEGGELLYDQYVCACRLQRDLAWELDGFDPDNLQSTSVANSIRIEAMKNADSQVLSHDADLGCLGRYNNRLGYYQNVLHFGLGKTLRLRINRLKAQTLLNRAPVSVLPQRSRQ